MACAPEAVKTMIAEHIQHEPGFSAPSPLNAEGPDASPITACAGSWWVVHTRSRQEKALAVDLDRIGIDCFLPLITVRRRYGGRTIRLQIPLFPSYLFMCGTEEHRYATLMTHRAAAVIHVADQTRLKHELGQIMRVTANDEPVDLYPGLRCGRRCRVITGSLTGLEGVVLQRRGTCRVYVGVEALGQSAELEIDPSRLEVIE